MKIEEAVKGTKVQTYPDGPTLTVKYTWGKYVALEIINEDGSREDRGMCPASMLDLVEV